MSADPLLDALFDATLDAVLVVDANAQVVRANAAAGSMLGIEEGALRNRPVAEVFSAPMATRFEAGLREVLASKSPFSSEEELVLENGTKRLLLVLQIPYGGEGGGAVAVARDITDRRRREDALRKYLDAMVKARDEERRQIARELHDEAGQALTSMLVRLRALERDPRIGEDDPLHSRLTDIVHVGEGLHRELSRLGRGLHPGVLETLGLKAALSHLAAEARKSGLKVEAELLAGPRLPLAIELAVYRIVQESTTNVVKHSRARALTIFADWSKPAALRLSVTDDGIGLSKSTTEPGVGLLGIRERVRQLQGEFSIASTDAGTRLEVNIPLGGLAP